MYLYQKILNQKKHLVKHCGKWYNVTPITIPNFNKDLIVFLGADLGVPTLPAPAPPVSTGSIDIRCIRIDSPDYRCEKIAYGLMNTVSSTVMQWLDEPEWPPLPDDTNYTDIFLVEIKVIPQLNFN